MMGRNGAGLRQITVGLVLATGLVLAACGDDDETSSSGGGGGGSAPQTITIEATGTAKAPTFKVPAKAKPGAATIEVTNGLKKGDVDGQLAFTTEQHTDEEVVAELQNAMEGKTVADWFGGGGGPGGAAPGETSKVEQELQEGTYYVLSGEGRPKLPLTKFVVSGETGAAVEAPAAKISAAEYGFSGEGVKSGETVLIENTGEEWHHFLASRLAPGKTIADARKFLKTEKGQPPFTDDENGLESTVLDPGFSQVVNIEGKPGKYAFFCFIADKKGGPPHVAKGMVSEVVVE